MKKPLFGLILCGGQSSRLGFSKHLIKKNNKLLFNWWIEHLNKFCEKVFISCQKNQLQSFDKIELILDQEEHSGPLEGIYRAFKLNNQVNWLVVAIDLVYIDDTHLQLLVSNTHLDFDAIAFKNQATGDAFPLFCIYKDTSFSKIELEYNTERKSARWLLNNLNTLLINIDEHSVLDGINTPQDYKRCIESKVCTEI